MTSEIGRLSDAFDVVPDAVLMLDEGGKILLANAAARRVFASQLTGGQLRDILDLDADGVVSLLAPLKSVSGPLPLALPLRSPSGKVEQRQASGQRLRDASAGLRFVLRIPPADANSFAALSLKVAELDREVRQRREAQKTAEEALEVNRLLTRELHHRVNNNLQLQVSLLRRSAKTTGNPEVRQFVRMAIGRIRAMSAGLDLIYRSGEGPGVGIGELVAKLVSQIEETLPAGWQISILMEAAFAVSTVQVAPLALIINEIAGDAVKRSPDTGGELVLTCQVIGDEHCLEIAQSEPGPPPEGSEARALIHTLARQAGTRIEFSSASPHRTRLVFERRQGGS